MSIIVSKVSKTLSGKTILSDVNCEIMKGKMTALIGPNGAGKSTLLSIISRLLSPDSGEVYLGGKALLQIPTAQIAQQLTVLKQSNHLDLRLSVEELVAFGRFPYSKGRLTDNDQMHISRALSFMALDDIRHKYIHQLSGGQRQRAFIAMTLAQDTDYILLDEPLNNLDMKHAVQIMQRLRQLCDEFGKTVVIVIHDINFAASYADFMIALKAGRVCAQGRVAEMMSSAVLSDIYDFPIAIHHVGNHPLALYFKSNNEGE
ncbi:iron ABC transporter ATP-binding protein [Spirabiliibacterium falconis]|uniref:iron ABC transporter ATP-binding protein n=1 Tax=Spirabiliibacterium falconis TaxID=572023 RepID=UPI001AAC5CDF|nr:ATP-binding cassette domain-containing protein [Spirabiliibacterium falconis]MBE2893582.1 ATP-binding cassette domain-containing protein [Spirabiliibacterium falconis]